jgi:hypothetical protein
MTDIHSCSYYCDRPECIKTQRDELRDKLAQPKQEPDYAWQTVADYEKDVGFQVGEAFKMAWSMARTTNALFKEMENT